MNRRTMLLLSFGFMLAFIMWRIWELKGDDEGPLPTPDEIIEALLGNWLSSSENANKFYRELLETIRNWGRYEPEPPSAELWRQVVGPGEFFTAEDTGATR